MLWIEKGLAKKFPVNCSCEIFFCPLCIMIQSDKTLGTYSNDSLPNSAAKMTLFVFFFLSPQNSGYFRDINPVRILNFEPFDRKISYLPWATSLAERNMPFSCSSVVMPGLNT